jgi:uncharacterized damage-inducible protein DinB
MQERDRILEQMRRMYAGGAWHGPSLTEALDGVTAAQAAARPLAGGHTIYELTHHVAAWIGEVHDRLGGKVPGNPADGDFPPPDERVDDAAWRRMRERLESRHRALMDALPRFDPSRLEDPVDPAQGPEGGVYYQLLHGLVQHNAYHAGQIMLLKRGLERRD